VRAKKAEIKRKDEIISKHMEEIQLMRSLLLTTSGTINGDGVTPNNGIGGKLTWEEEPVGDEQRSQSGDQATKPSVMLDEVTSFAGGITNLMTSLSSMLSSDNFGTVEELVDQLSTSHRTTLEELMEQMSSNHKSELTETRTKNKDLIHEVEEMKFEVEQLGTANKNLTAELMKAKETLSELREQEAVQAPNNKLLQSQLSETQHQLEEYQTRYERSSSLLEETQIKLQQSSTQYQEAEARLEESTSKLKEFESQCNEFQIKLEEANTSLQNKVKELEQVSEELELSQKSFSDLKDSKLQFITQSSLEIERLKSVIRNYSNPIKGDGSQQPNRAPAVLSFSGWV